MLSRRLLRMSFRNYDHVFARVLAPPGQEGRSSGLKKSSEASLPRDGVVGQVQTENSMLVIEPPRLAWRLLRDIS